MTIEENQGKLLATVTFKRYPHGRFEVRESELIHEGLSTHTCGPSLDDNLSCAFFRRTCPAVATDMCRHGVYFVELK